MYAVHAYVMLIIMHLPSDDDSDPVCTQASAASNTGSKDLLLLPRVAASLHIIETLVEGLKRRQRRVKKIPLEVSLETLKAAHHLTIAAIKQKMVFMEVCWMQVFWQQIWI